MWKCAIHYRIQCVKWSLVQNAHHISAAVLRGSELITSGAEREREGGGESGDVLYPRHVKIKIWLFKTEKIISPTFPKNPCYPDSINMQIYT